MRFHSNSNLAVGTLLLAAAWMIAPAASAAPAQSAQQRQAGIAVAHAGGNGVRHMAGNKNSGENPLYESKDKANLKPNAGASTVEYKDPEDMTTRYRPGNNKTTANPIATDHATARPKKHLAGVKYADRTSGGGNQVQTPRTAGRGPQH